MSSPPFPSGLEDNAKLKPPGPAASFGLRARQLPQDFLPRTIIKQSRKRQQTHCVMRMPSRQ